MSTSSVSLQCALCASCVCNVSRMYVGNCVVVCLLRDCWWCGLRRANKHGNLITSHSWLPWNEEARDSLIECQQPIDNHSCNDHIRSSEFYVFYASWLTLELVCGRHVEVLLAYLNLWCMWRTCMRSQKYVVLWSANCLYCSEELELQVLC